jgi:endoglucanase
MVGLAVAVSLAGCATSDANSGPANSGPANSGPAKTGPTFTRKVDNPLSSARLYVSSESPAAHQVAVWRSLGQGEDAATLQRIARQSTATWLTGNQPPALTAAALVRQSSRVGATAQIVLYDIPDRDCKGFSTGGAASSSQYLAWVHQVSRGIGEHAAIIILEPDAIDQAASGCLSPSAAAARYQDLAQAVTMLKADPRAHVYIDAGNSGWLPVSRIVQPLRAAGIAKASGFALNVANFETTKDSVAYGQALSRDLGGRHFVIDTSRNGAGPPSSAAGVDHWCNPPGRALGAPPTTHTGYPQVDAFLWIKYPGESDGQCGNGDPPAGTWWPSYGLALAQASSQH